MNTSLKQKIDAAFIVGIVFILVGMYFTYKSTEDVKENNRWIDHTRQVLFQIEKTLTLTVDIESGTRGYIISGNEIFLEPVETAKAQLPEALDTLRAFYDKSASLNDIDTFLSLVNKKIIWNTQGATIRRIKGEDEALDFVATGTGKRLMDEIRKKAKELEVQESESLKKRLGESVTIQLVSNRNLAILSCLIIIAFLILYTVIRKNAEQLIQYQKKQDELIRELNYQNRQLDDFASILSHNLRSPATNISTLISFVNESSSIDDYKLIFEKLGTVSKNLNESLGELVDVLHVRKDKTIARTLQAFEEVLKKVMGSLEGDILKTKAEVQYDFHAAPTIEYPKTYLESIFHNLISNALKYRAANRTPKIIITTDIHGGNTRLTVTDNGQGIDMNKFGDKLFGLRKTFHHHPEAKGIGLFMTKAQIEALGGKITVESEVDKGTTFTVTF